MSEENQMTHAEAEVLVREWGWLIEAVARKLWYPGGVEMDDLVQEGRLALLKAHVGFNLERGVSFKTYAGVTMRNCMVDWLRRHGATVRVPMQKQKTVKLYHVPIHLLREEGHSELVAPEGEGHAGNDTRRLGALNRALRALPADERRVIALRYREPRARLREVAKRLGMTLITVQRREKRGLERLRDMLGAE